MSIRPCRACRATGQSTKFERSETGVTIAQEQICQVCLGTGQVSTEHDSPPTRDQPLSLVLWTLFSGILGFINLYNGLALLIPGYSLANDPDSGAPSFVGGSGNFVYGWPEEAAEQSAGVIPFLTFFALFFTVWGVFMLISSYKLYHLRNWARYSVVINLFGFLAVQMLFVVKFGMFSNQALGVFVLSLLAFPCFGLVWYLFVKQDIRVLYSRQLTIN